MLPSTLLDLLCVPEEPGKHRASTVAVCFTAFFFSRNKHTLYYLSRTFASSPVRTETSSQKEGDFACFPFTPHSWVLWVNMCLITPSCVLITEERRRMEHKARLEDKRGEEKTVLPSCHWWTTLKAGAAFNYSLCFKQTLRHVSRLCKRRPWQEVENTKGGFWNEEWVSHPVFSVSGKQIWVRQTSLPHSFTSDTDFWMHKWRHMCTTIHSSPPWMPAHMDSHNNYPSKSGQWVNMPPF